MGTHPVSLPINLVAGLYITHKTILFLPHLFLYLGQGFINAEENGHHLAIDSPAENLKQAIISMTQREMGVS